MKDVNLKQSSVTAGLTVLFIGIAAYGLWKYADWKYGISAAQESISPLLAFFNRTPTAIPKTILSGKN